MPPPDLTLEGIAQTVAALGCAEATCASPLHREVKWLLEQVRFHKELADTCVAHIAEDQVIQHLPLSLTRELDFLRAQVARYEGLLGLTYPLYRVEMY